MPLSADTVCERNTTIQKDNVFCFFLNCLVEKETDIHQYTNKCPMLASFCQVITQRS